MSFWAELRRRNVFKVGAAYGIVAWILIQVVATVFPALRLPEWTTTFVIVLVLLGLPVALMLAWAFELTPDGIKRTDDVPHAESITYLTGQKLNYIVTGLLVIAVGFMAADNYLFRNAPGATEAGATATGAPPGPASALARTREVLPNSVAVLPLENMSPDPDDAYFAAGIHEEILNYLVKLKALNVISRTSMMRYAKTDKSPEEIAKELNVKTVMEGSVRYADDRVRITMQLIDGATGSHLWSEAYERDFKDIFAIQADIAMNVANALNAAFTPEEQQRIEREPDVSPTTYALMLQFINLASTGNQSGRTVAMLDQMIAADPKYAVPYGLKALVYANLLVNTTYGSAVDRAEAERLVRANAERALALDPTTLPACSAVALVDLFSWHWTEASQRYDACFRATGRHGAYFDWFASWTGREADALEEGQRGIALSPVEWGAHWSNGIVRSYAGDYDGATLAFQRAIDLTPGLSLQHSWLAIAEIGRGNSDAALRNLRIAEQLLGDQRTIISLLDILYGYGRIGRRADAERVFAEIQALAATQDIGAGGWALAHLAIGDEGKALEWLRTGVERAQGKVVDQGFFSLMNIRANYSGDPVLEQPEFVVVRDQLTGY